jgi:hypothetical protein
MGNNLNKMKRGDISMSKHHHHRDCCGKMPEYKDRCCRGPVYMVYPVSPMRDPDPDPDPCYMTPGGPSCSVPGAGNPCFMTPRGPSCSMPYGCRNY